MNKFHHIPTDQFIPISHDNSYLFNHYDKVSNFLAFNLEKNYKSILAKPVQNGYIIDWFSPHLELKDIKEYNRESSEKALSDYWNFIGLINTKVDQLQNSNDENNKNWAGLLNKVFNHNDNFVFFNGTNISIIWGWKFENKENYKPNFKSGSQEPEFILGDEFVDPTEERNQEEIEEKIESIEQKDEETEEINDPFEVQIEDIVEEEIYEEEIPEEKASFLEFLKWFASKFWWTLGILLFLILVVLLARTFIPNSNYTGNNNDLTQIENRAHLL